MSAEEPQSLREAQEWIDAHRPARDAPLRDWRDHFRASSELYTEIADIDRRHHHEALACARIEREAAEQLSPRIVESQRIERE